MGAVDRMLTVQRPRAAGNLGIFRILFSLFYLWHLSTQRVDWAAAPGIEAEVWATRVVPIVPAGGLRFLEATLVAALILLGFGWRTRVMTFVVLVIGTYLDAGLTNIDHEQGTAILVFWIPLAMLLFDGWGDCHGIDAASRNPRVDSDESGPRYTLGPRVLLVILSVLFFSAAVWKVGVGSWWTNGDQMRNIILQADVIASLNLLPGNPLSGIMTDIAPVHQAMRFIVPAFEGLFFLALVNRATERFMVAGALILHAMSAIFIAVTFAPLVIVYAAFIDWRPVASASPTFRLDRRRATPVVVAVAVALAVGWYRTEVVRDMLNLGGLVNFRTIFVPILPIAVIGLVLAARSIASGLRPAPVTTRGRN